MLFFKTVFLLKIIQKKKLVFIIKDFLWKILNILLRNVKEKILTMKLD